MNKKNRKYNYLFLTDLTVFKNKFVENSFAMQTFFFFSNKFDKQCTYASENSFANHRQKPSTNLYSLPT